jgi:RNA polymerase sigma factor (sigma-70 family)
MPSAPPFARHAPRRRRTAPAPVGDLSDHELLRRIADADDEAPAVFVARYERRVYGLALTILADARAAEDVAQEALLRAWRNAGAFDARRGTVWSWLSTITRNLAIDAIRLRRRVVLDGDALYELSIPAPTRDPGDEVVVLDDIAWLREALADLPDEQRRAVVLAGVWGLTAREIAEREGIPLGTAKTRIRTALGRLRAALHPVDQTCEPAPTS